MRWGGFLGDKFNNFFLVINCFSYFFQILSVHWISLYMCAIPVYEELQIFAFFLFSNFRERQIAPYSPCRLVGWSVGWSVGWLVAINFSRHKSPFLTQYHLIQNSTKLYWPSITKYQPVLPHTDPVPPNTSHYRPILTQYNHISMSLATVSLAITSLRTMSLGTIVPRYNCFMRQLFLLTIVLGNNYSSVPLQMVIYKEDGPPDDQNQGDRGARIVANDHPGDLASFVLLHSFAKRTVLRMTKIKGSEEQELLQMIIQMIRPTLFLCKRSFAKRTVL